jgi:hypothetical protein
MIESYIWGPSAVRQPRTRRADDAVELDGDILWVMFDRSAGMPLSPESKRSIACFRLALASAGTALAGYAVGSLGHGYTPSLSPLYSP